MINDRMINDILPCGNIKETFCLTAKANLIVSAKGGAIGRMFFYGTAVNFADAKPPILHRF